MRFADVHLLYDDEVVVHGNYDIDEPDSDEGVEPFLHGRDKDVQLSDEAGQRRHPGQRQEENEHRKGKKGRPAAQAAVVVDFFTADGFAHGDDNDKGTEIGEKIGQEVEQHRVAAHLRTGGETDQHVADLGDTGIGQESFHVLLGDSHDVTVGHGQDGRSDKQQGTDWLKGG